MKKTKLLGLKVAVGSLLTLTPLCALTACSTSDNNSTRVESKIFSIKDNAVVGLAPGMTQKDFKQYCASNHDVITIPYGVKEIKSHAFDPTAGGVSVPFGAEIKIPNTVEQIEDYGFYHCSAGSVEFYGTGQSKLQYIGKAAFCGCELLTKFDFPKALVDGTSTEVTKHGIGPQAFMDCPLLTTLNFSALSSNDSGKPFSKLLDLKIGHDAFTAGYHYIDSQSTVAYIKLPMNGNQPYETTDANNIVAGEFRSRLIASGLAVRYRTSDNTWKSIWGFRDSYKEDVEIEGVQTGAFNVYYPVPTNWLEVDNYGELIGVAPQFCVDLPQFNTLFVPNKKVNYNPEETVEAQSITHFSSEFNILNYKAKYTKKITNFEHLWIQDKQGDDGITEIPNELCSGNADVVIEKETVKYDAFKTALKSVRLPSTALTIGNNAFDLCNKLAQVNLNEAAGLTSIGVDAFAHDTTLGNFVSKPTSNSRLALSNTVKTVGDEAFYNCDSIVGIKLWVPADSTATLSIGTMAFGSLGGLSQVDASALDYHWHTKVGTQDEHATGTFTKWMDIPETNRYFDNVPEGQGTKIIDLPTGATPRQFMGLENDEEKEDWDSHPNSGFAKLMEQSGENHNFYDWVLNEGYSIRGGSTSLSSRETSAGSDAGHPWKAYHRDTEITTFEEAPHLVGVTDAASQAITDGKITFSNDGIVFWEKGLNSNSSYKFKVSAKYKPSEDAEVIEINSDVITLTILKQEFSISTNDSITAEFKQEGSTTFDFKYNGGTITPELGEVKNVNITCVDEWVTLDVDNKIINWSKLFNQDTTIELSADFIPADEKLEKQTATVTINLFGTAAKELTISTGASEITWAQDDEVKTEQYISRINNQGLVHSVTSQWSISGDTAGGKISINQNTGVLTYADSTIPAGDYNITIKANYTEEATGYTYEATKDVIIHIIAAKNLVIEGSNSIVYEKGQSAPIVVYSAHLENSSTTVAATWSIDTTISGVSIDATSGQLSYSNASVGTDNNATISAEFTNDNGYTYTATKTISISILAQREVIITSVELVGSPTFTPGVASTGPVSLKINATLGGQAIDMSGIQLIKKPTTHTGDYLPTNHSDPFHVSGSQIYWDQYIYATDYTISFTNVTYKDEATGRIYSNIAVPDLNIHVSPLAFENCPWATVVKAANFHEARTVSSSGVENYNGLKCYFGANCLNSSDSTNYIVGKENKVKINGLDHTVRLVDYNHDLLDSSGSKHAALTFDFKNVICDSNGHSLGICWAYNGQNDNYINANLNIDIGGATTERNRVYTTRETSGHGDSTAAGSWNYPQYTVLQMIRNENDNRDLILNNGIKTVYKQISIKQDNTWIVKTYPTALFSPTVTEIAPDATETTKFAKEGTTYKYFATKTGTELLRARAKGQIKDTDVNFDPSNTCSWYDGRVSQNKAGRVITSKYGTGYYWLASPNISGANVWGVNEGGTLNGGVWGPYTYWLPFSPFFCI